MKAIYRGCAACFRWFMAGMFALIIVLPAIISLSTDV